MPVGLGVLARLLSEPPEVRYEMDVGSDHLFAATEAPEEGTLDDVFRLIRATDAWSRTRGDGVTIAIVDTGVDGTRPEFGPARRVGQWPRWARTPGRTGRATA